MAKNNQATSKEVDFEITAAALAKTMYEGDIVNFRLLFLPFSPARSSSTERFDMPKYGYLLPEESEENEPGFQACLALVMAPATRAFIAGELDANRPAQLPSELVLELGDNAVRTGKYSSAAQAYEMLRIRDRMQQLFLEAADAALDAGDVARGVHGYLVAIGLAYDYAAFPEPLPLVPDFQTRALMLHAEYPETPGASVGMQESGALVQAALNYLLLQPEVVARLERRPEAQRVEFVKELVRQRDPRWDDFVANYHAGVAIMEEFAERVRQGANNEPGGLEEEIRNQLGGDPRSIAAALLGREVQGGEWWQYLKELAGEHPAAALFVARQVVGDLELLVPRHRADSPVALALGVNPGP